LLEVMWQHKRAKQVQLRVTSDAPLAICMGDSYRVLRRALATVTAVTTPYVEGDVKFTVKGCFRIFEDATTMVGDMWPAFCADCNNRVRQPKRDQRRAIARRITTLARTPNVYESWVRLPPLPDEEHR
jgi:hypothetical protein